MLIKDENSMESLIHICHNKTLEEIGKLGIEIRVHDVHPKAFMQ